MKSRKGSGYAIASILLTFVALLGLYFFRPWLHGLVMLVYTTPILILVGVLLLAGGIWSLTRSEVGGTAFGMLAVFILLTGVIFSGAFAKETMSTKVENEMTTIDTLPDVDSSQPRILPRSVAERQADDSLSEPRYQLGESDIAISDEGKPYWSMPLVPDGFVNYLTQKQKGASQVDMTTSGKQINYLDEKMDYGLGMGITDSLGWQLRKDSYFVNYGDSRVLSHENETYIATPYKTYNFHWKFVVPYTTPEFGGVALTDSEGQTDYIDAEDVESNPVLQDQSIYPYDLAHYEISSLEYKNGFINTWFLHEDQLEVASVPGLGNDQPFTVLTEREGAELFIAAEPYGNAQGLFRIYLLDAQTGKPKVLKVERDKALLGAAKATDYVRKANSKVNWADRSTGEDTVQTGFQPSEPLPVIVDDQLYWQVRVVPVDSTGIAFTSFVNAQTGDVITTASDTSKMDRQIVNFLDTGSMEDVEPKPGTGNESQTGEPPEEGEWQLVVIEDGQVVDSVTVQEGQSFELRRR